MAVSVIVPPKVEEQIIESEFIMSLKGSSSVDSYLLVKKWNQAWKKFTAGAKLIDKKGVDPFALPISKNLGAFEDEVEPNYKQMDKYISLVIKDLNTLKLANHIKGTEFLKYLLKVLDAAGKKKTQIAKSALEYKKAGPVRELVEVDVLLIASDFRNKNINSAVVNLEIGSIPKDIKLSGKMKGGKIRFNKVLVRPTSNVAVKLTLPRKFKKILEKNIVVKNLKRGSRIAIEAKEEALIREVTTMVAEKTIKHLGGSAGFGLEFKIVRLGAEVDTFKEWEDSKSESVKVTMHIAKGEMILSSK